MIKIKKIKQLLIILFVVFNASCIYGQEDYIVNHSKFMQKTNPSYFGFNMLFQQQHLFDRPVDTFDLLVLPLAGAFLYHNKSNRFADCLL